MVDLFAAKLLSRLRRNAELTLAFGIELCYVIGRSLEWAGLLSWLLWLLDGVEGQVGALVRSQSGTPKLGQRVLAPVVGDVALVKKWLDHKRGPVRVLLLPVLLLPREQQRLLAFYL